LAFIVWLGRIALVIRLHHSRNEELSMLCIGEFLWIGDFQATSDPAFSGAAADGWGVMSMGSNVLWQSTSIGLVAQQLLQLRYPIERIRTADNYPGGDDELSMEDNNTSAFNCRDIPGTGRWSQHAFGRAL